MKKNPLNPKILIASLFISTAFFSCASNPLLTENIELGVQEKQKLNTAVDRSSNKIVYHSNLNNFTYPTEEELAVESNMKNSNLYSLNLKVLTEWILKGLSAKQRFQLGQNCQALVGSFQTNFPLDETTIACAGWWIEKQNAISSEEHKFTAIPETNNIRMSIHQRKNWLAFQDLSIMQVLPLIDIDTPKNQEFYINKSILYANDCSLKNANAALIFKLENYLPNKKIYASMEKIYTKMQTCLTPNDEPAEKIHLRMGLLRLLVGNTSLGFEALKKTQLEKNPKENSRNLFWLGTIFQKNNPTEKTNPYWRQLIKENPLSFSSLVALQQMGQDPESVLVPDEQISLQNRVEGGWTKENLETFIFDMLFAKKRIDAAEAWANYVAKNIDTTNPNILLYWSLTQNKLHNYYNSILMLSRYTRYTKDYLASPGLVSLQFPKPYLQEIMQASNNVDPIFILALMRQESAFDEFARSGANARGLMQLLPSTAKRIKRSIRPNDLYDPDTNIEVGQTYLETLFKKYDGKSEYVLAAYNAGASNVDKWLLRVPSENTMLFCDFIPYRETRSYISIILRNYYWYSRILLDDKSKFTRSVLNKSLSSQFKPKRVQALLSSSSKEVSLTQEQKDMLNKIYIFGEDNHLSALRTKQRY